MIDIYVRIYLESTFLGCEIIRAIISVVKRDIINLKSTYLVACKPVALTCVSRIDSQLELAWLMTIDGSQMA